MPKIGYARISTRDQKLDLQTSSLTEDGCERIFCDTVSGAKTERPGLTDALEYLRNGDTLVVWKLDRLGRSMIHLIETVTALNERSVQFRSITEGIDTSSSGGTLIFHVFGALAQFERDIIRERTNAGLKAAAARGRKGGRKPSLTNEMIERAKMLIKDGLTVREAAARIRVGKSTLYKALSK